MTDLQIIQGCKKQIPRFQKELVVRYSGLLLTVCRRYVGSRETARDVLQESFIRIFRSIEKYKEQGKLIHWMKKIVINVALQQINKSYFKNEDSGLELLPEKILLPRIYHQLAAEDLLLIIQQLPLGFRTVFNLYAIEGYSHQEIAELLGITKSTSRSQLARARQILQKKIGQPKKMRI